MAYKEILSLAIKNSELSLREIATRCETLGITISPSYISQLQTGKLPPPSEEITRAIAQVCMLPDPIDLIFEGYLEKAPELIKYYLTVTSETNKQLLQLLMPSFHSDINEDYIRMLDKFTALGSSISYLRKLQRSKSIIPLIDLYNVIVEKMFSNSSFDELEQVFMEDDSMEPVIPKNAKLKTAFYRGSEPQEKDIIAFNKKGDKKVFVRRYYKHDDIITLIPENRSHDIIYIKHIHDIEMYGKVISYTSGINY